MNTEINQLIENAAKMLGIRDYNWLGDHYHYFPSHYFNPLDPERGDLMMVAEAAELDVDFYFDYVATSNTDGTDGQYKFTKGDYQSLALAVLRAASAVLKARGE